MSHVIDSTMADDRIIVARAPSPSLGQALLTLGSNTTTNTARQRRSDK